MCIERLERGGSVNKLSNGTVIGHIWQKVVPNNTTESDKIFSVHQKICNQTGNSFHDYRLYYEGKSLGFVMTLSECGIEHGSMIELFMNHSGC